MEAKVRHTGFSYRGKKKITEAAFDENALKHYALRLHKLYPVIFANCSGIQKNSSAIFDSRQLIGNRKMEYIADFRFLFNPRHFLINSVIPNLDESPREIQSSFGVTFSFSLGLLLALPKHQIIVNNLLNQLFIKVHSYSQLQNQHF